MVVIEDVDLIARSRDRMRGACDESPLNSLLNEMDGPQGEQRRPLHPHHQPPAGP
jgi:hypothetical protein